MPRQETSNARTAGNEALYRRRLWARSVDGGSGAVTAVQRVSSDLRLDPHFHALALDDVFAEGAGGELSFHPLPCLTNDDVTDLLQVARVRVLHLLRRKGVIADDAVTADASLADSEPALAELAVSSTLGTVPAGPTLRRCEPITLREDAGLEPARGLCAAGRGFALHAATTASAGDAAGREALCKYILRPPIAAERVQLVADDLVRLVLKRPFSDGTFAIDLDPLSLLCRLAAAVRPPRFNTVRYAGALAAASSWRAHIVPPLPAAPGKDDDKETCAACGYPFRRPRPWARADPRRTGVREAPRSARSAAQSASRPSAAATRRVRSTPRTACGRHSAHLQRDGRAFIRTTRTVAGRAERGRRNRGSVDGLHVGQGLAEGGHPTPECSAHSLSRIERIVYTNHRPNERGRGPSKIAEDDIALSSETASLILFAKRDRSAQHDLYLPPALWQSNR